MSGILGLNVLSKRSDVGNTGDTGDASNGDASNESGSGISRNQGQPTANDGIAANLALKITASIDNANASAALAQAKATSAAKPSDKDTDSDSDAAKKQEAEKNAAATILALIQARKDEICKMQEFREFDYVQKMMLKYSKVPDVRNRFTSFRDKIKELKSNKLLLSLYVSICLIIVFVTISGLVKFSLSDIGKLIYIVVMIGVIKFVARKLDIM
jgi:hypothetical protein